MGCAFKIVSGGQTGADRAALDWAINRGVPHGGWCPRGRLAEDGAIPARYELRETPDPDYAQRTEWNVRDADATVIFSCKRRLSGGSRLTSQLARRLGKPCLHLCKEMGVERAARLLGAFLRLHRTRVLNVAGSRHSEEPEVGLFVIAVLERAYEAAVTSGQGVFQQLAPEALLIQRRRTRALALRLGPRAPSALDSPSKTA